MYSPRFAQIEPVGQCNLRCQMCPIQYRRDGPPWTPPAFMPYRTFVQLINQMPQLQDLHLQGLGEPFLHPQLFEMIGYAARRGIRVTTNSNVTVLRPHLAERCVNSGLRTLYASVDAATARTYESIRVGARWSTLWSNLDTLLSTRARLERAEPRLVLVMVLMRRTLSELPGLVRLAARHGLDEVFVQHLCHDFGESTLPRQYEPMKRFVQAETLLHEDVTRIQAAFAEAREAAHALNVKLRLPHLPPQASPAGVPGAGRCSWPWRGPYLSYRGDALPCCMIATPDRFQLGNMAQDGVMAIWGGAAYQEFRERLRSDNPHEICRSCSVYHGTF